MPAPEKAGCSSTLLPNAAAGFTFSSNNRFANGPKQLDGRLWSFMEGGGGTIVCVTASEPTTLQQLDQHRHQPAPNKRDDRSLTRSIDRSLNRLASRRNILVLALRLVAAALSTFFTDSHEDGRLRMETSEPKRRSASTRRQSCMQRVECRAIVCLASETSLLHTTTANGGMHGFTCINCSSS